MQNTGNHGRCFGCFRPRDDCFCDAIPSISNETGILILQHRRESKHAFNTARIISRALKNCELRVGYTAELAAERLPIDPRAGLLYPGPQSTQLSEVTDANRPHQLIIVDGTWHHAKTIVRDVSALRRLPCYGINPSQPGRYRIRREPSNQHLSSLEATVAALRAIEPETSGLQELLAAFDSMIERQLSHPNMRNHWRRNSRRQKSSAGIPHAISQNLPNIVVAYGESAPGGPGSQKGHSTPVYWVAERIGTAETFRCRLQHQATQNDTYRAHLKLPGGDPGTEVSLQQFRELWQSFLRPSDVMATYHEGTARLLRNVGGPLPKYVVLKSAYAGLKRFGGTLDDIVRAEALPNRQAVHPGRAGTRLANAVALTWFLHQFAQSCLADSD